jgi:hypothetical protein
MADLWLLKRSLRHTVLGRFSLLAGNRTAAFATYNKPRGMQVPARYEA